MSRSGQWDPKYQISVPSGIRSLPDQKSGIMLSCCVCHSQHTRVADRCTIIVATTVLATKRYRCAAQSSRRTPVVLKRRSLQPWRTTNTASADVAVGGYVPARSFRISSSAGRSTRGQEKPFEARSITTTTLGAVPAAVAFSNLASLMLVNAGAAKALAIAAVSKVALAAPLPVAPANGMQGCSSRGCWGRR